MDILHEGQVKYYVIGLFILQLWKIEKTDSPLKKTISLVGTYHLEC